jgi:hypothetical protein
VDADTSGPACDRLVNEIAALDSVDTAIEWASRSLSAKNNLTAEDASTVEAVFRDRMRLLEPDVFPPKPVPSVAPPAGAAPEGTPAGSANRSAASGVRLLAVNPLKLRKGQSSRIPVEANSVTTAKLRRSRDKDHLRFIAIQPCIMCGRQPCEAHHLRFAQPRALGRRVSDEFTVPLCRVHHRELHRQGDERAWWNKVNIDPLAVALRFWQHTRGSLPAGNSNHKPQDSSLSIEVRSGAGGPSDRKVPSGLFDATDGSTSR